MEKRKFIRFDPETNSLVILSSRDKKHKSMLVVGLLRDESGHGCGAIFRKPFPFRKNEPVQATVGKLMDLNGKIMWVKDFDEVLVKVGVFLD